MPEAAMNDERRYLLGNLDESRQDAIEDRYFASPDAVDAIAQEEEALIEDYLSGQLSAAERDRFERHYLASPVHQRRLEVVRGLSRARSSQWQPYGWLAAAAVLLVAAGGVWRFTQQAPRPPAVATTREPSPAAPQTAAPAPQRVFAFTVSPINVRSDTPSPALVVPASTDVVVLELQQEGARPPVTDRTVTFRSVDGRDAWTAAAVTTDLRAGVLARVEVPAGRLTPDDYFVEIAGYRYVLRVRAK
jgi:hypothetical protein